MEKVNLTKRFLLLVIILEQNMNNFLRRTMKVIVQWFNKKCDNNKMRSIFENTTLHNLNKGSRQSYLNLPFAIP
jgi:hypothetical protein